MEDQTKIAHYHNLIKLINACPYWAADQNFELVQLYVWHVVEGKPKDEHDKSAYDKMFSIINEENNEST